MRPIDLPLLFLLCLAVFGIVDPAGAANLVSHWNDQLHTLLHRWL